MNSLLIGLVLCFSSGIEDSREQFNLKLEQYPSPPAYTNYKIVEFRPPRIGEDYSNSLGHVHRAKYDFKNPRPIVEFDYSEMEALKAQLTKEGKL